MSVKTIKNYIDADVKYNLTPDLPILRYYGRGIPVFLWDDLQDYSTFSAILGSLPLEDCYEARFPNAVTQNKYVPWYNMDESKESFAAYCLEEYEDLAFLDVPSYTMGMPKQIKGKIAAVSLEALQELDCYYENQEIFTRCLIKVYPSNWTSTPMEVFAWFNSVDQISSFDTETSEYILDKNIDLTPFRDNSSPSGKEYYEM